MMNKLKPHDTIRVFEGFAGYGGATYGLRRAGINHEVIGYSEFDKFAAALYDANHKDKNGDLIKNWWDITKVNPEELPDFDLFTGGFPCQPFSQVGMQQGENDKHGRGTLMYDILRICKVKKPKYIFLENVKGLVTKRFQKTFNTLKDSLREMGYGDLHYSVLNTKDYGIPQNRERVWIFARLGGLPDDFSMIPPTIENGLKLKDFVDKNPEEKLYLSQAQIQRIKDFYGIKSFVVSEYSCFDLYNKKIRNDGLSITILAPEHNKMRMVEPTKPDGTEVVRKYSVSEQFRLMGFKDGEIDFAGQSYTQLSKRAANGWDINIVGILLNHIWEQLL
ncbi:DNA (cytosine-5-)-methyltransferase [Holdemanella porci]|uniref:DNA (cytosine-5-)-methyltransferase n=1 Tax=Holdemanella porci TaxID=2652276 RepID=UPI00388D55E3